MAIVYGLRAKDSDVYFYVGCTHYESVEIRLKQHLAEVRTMRKVNRYFVNKVRKLGEENIVADVLETMPFARRFEREKWWIADLTAKGVRLVNRVHNGLIAFDKGDIVCEAWTRDELVWAMEWYAGYQQGLRCVPLDRPKQNEIVQFAEQQLVITCRRILAKQLEEVRPVLEQAGIKLIG